MVEIIYSYVINNLILICADVLPYSPAMYCLFDIYFVMKVYTCVSEAVLAEFIPSSTPKFKFYRDSGAQFALFEDLAFKLRILKKQVCTFKDISF